MCRTVKPTRRDLKTILPKPEIHHCGQRHNHLVCRLHGYCLIHLKVTFDNALQPKLLPSRSEGSFRDVFSIIFQNDVEVIFPKLPENKSGGPFMVS
ncbi:hypothetical protein AVEN_209959-1 [Araneus ventricosus]|uniref:Uncharacterized protein n=1 Tax=Araneus ventricosus TaxID=182803 RepID=A0A4Y2DBH5_ARAVE|nr:hypothetical protein AVEN_209959-1 [Araneus ventricosus]